MIFMCFMSVLFKTLNKWLLLNRRPYVCPGSLKQNRTFRLSEGTGLSMETVQ